MPAPNVPATDLILAAMRHAVAIRVAGYHCDERYDRYTLAALKERVVGLPAPPRARRDGWWAIGRILDEVADLEWRVWMHPQRRTLKMAARPILEPEIPTPGRRPDGRYYDGARRRWVNAAEDAAAGMGGAIDGLEGPNAVHVGGATFASPDASDLADRP